MRRINHSPLLSSAVERDLLTEVNIRIIHFSKNYDKDKIPEKTLQKIRLIKNVKDRDYEGLEFEVEIPSSLDDDFFIGLNEYIDNYTKFKEFLSERDNTS